MSSPQLEFDNTYITSSEICKRLRINRCTLLQARRNGVLPDPIRVNGTQLYIWIRNEVNPALKSWAAKRGIANA